MLRSRKGICARRGVCIQPNRLIWGDNFQVMQALLAQGYEGQIDYFRTLYICQLT
jgi:hypothetical protein